MKQPNRSRLETAIRAAVPVALVCVIAGCWPLTELRTAASVTVWIRDSGLMLEPGATFQTGVTVLDEGRSRGVFYFPDRSWPSDVQMDWVSSNPDVVEVDASGLVLARLNGEATVWVNVEGATDSARVLVRRDPSRSKRFRSLTVGLSRACAIDVDGMAWCWGSDWHGALGRGTARTFTRFHTPGPVAGAHRFQAVSAGREAVCGITEGGETFCWGGNVFGELGHGTAGLTGPYISGSSLPVRIADDPGFQSIALGYGHGCGLDGQNRAHCWGSNFRGEIGAGSLERSFVPRPTRVSGNLEFSRIETGPAFHTCALTTLGKAYCWGNNDRGQLGSDIGNAPCPSGTCSPVPVEVEGDIEFVAVTPGLDFTCGLDREGSTYCWGRHPRNVGDESGISASPLPIQGAPPFERLSAGDEHVCGLMASGEVYCWGQNLYGQLGRTEGVGTRDEHEPRPVSGDARFVEVSAQRRYTCGLTVDRGVYCWGWNHQGQLGLGASDSPQPLPQRIVDPLH